GPPAGTSRARSADSARGQRDPVPRRRVRPWSAGPVAERPVRPVRPARPARPGGFCPAVVGRRPPFPHRVLPHRGLGHGTHLGFPYPSLWRTDPSLPGREAAFRAASVENATPVESHDPP